MSAPVPLLVAASLAAALLGFALPCGEAQAASSADRTGLKPFAVTIRVFDPTRGLDSGQDYVLPVDSPDAEHAAASTLANAASFTPKIENGRARPVAFTCVKVEPR